MSNLKSKGSSFVTKTLAGSILFASCAPDATIEQTLNDQAENQNHAKETENNKGVPISLNLDEATKASLNQLAPLVQEIILRPETAKDFAKNPNLFCIKRGYNLTFEMDDAIYRVIAALGNEKSNAAIQNNDFDSFIQTCNELHLLDENQQVQLNLVFQNDEEQELFNSIAQQLNGEKIETRSVALVLAVSVALALAIVLVYTVGLGDGDLPGDIVRPPLNPDYSIPDSFPGIVRPISPQQAFLHSNNPNHSVFDVWALKNKNIHTYQVVSEYKSHLASQITAFLKEKKPEIFNNVTETQLYEFLKRNMIV